MPPVSYTELALLLFALTSASHGLDLYHQKTAAPVAKKNSAWAETSSKFWRDNARAAIAARLARPLNLSKARNVVMFLGDGMSVPTLSAARTLLGQRQGLSGEEAQLSFETFPTSGLSKTYCVDAQIPDSACTATAYLCGIKANLGTIGVNANVSLMDCNAAAEPQNQVDSIAAWALSDGRDAGIVTTTCVTNASPAGAYAHTSTRYWESDEYLPFMCPAPYPSDIALQLVHSHPGNKFKIILGGGRRELLPNTVVDEEGGQGARRDGRNLIEEWQEDKRARNVSYQYVWNRDQLLDTMADLPEYLLGLFEESKMQYYAHANPTTEPTLAELTEVAIRSLSRNEKGFFLFVEGGRIDHGHHENLAHIALDETIKFSEAVARATELLSEEDSLVVVTSDHAHVMTFAGYSARGTDITGPSEYSDSDGVPYMTLSYANGPGFRPHTDVGMREDIGQQDYNDMNFVYEATVPLDSETHGGDDVAVFAWGPHHHMFTGLYEQNHIPHLMAYAACIGPGPHACDRT